MIDSTRCTECLRTRFLIKPNPDSKSGFTAKEVFCSDEARVAFANGRPFVACPDDLTPEDYVVTLWSGLLFKVRRKLDPPKVWTEGMDVQASYSH